ncbi:unannotated protein [freshwater metagenome]|uniref:Unannotated protein n=1 Tax=freshwater metagenome TaxID=449393 RepID=A0A6J6ME58_9ZZZZ
MRSSKGSRLTRNFVTKIPSGLKRGPLATRATKPKESGIRIHQACVAKSATDMITTPVATSRADTSFTGFGKVKSVRTRPRALTGARIDPEEVEAVGAVEVVADISQG